MFNHRLRIASSLLLAFIIVNIYVNFTGIKDAIADFQFPKINVGKLFSLNFNAPNNEVVEQLNNQGGEPVNFYQTTPVPTLPRRSPSIIMTKAGPTNIPDSSTPMPTVRNGFKPFPTNIKSTIKSTKTPRPTKTPKPTPTPKPPPITTDLRPGKTMMEIFQEVSKRMCFPPALLMAFQTKESGPFFKSTNPESVIKIYNTYGWWKTGAGNPCFGLGYHTQTGIVPPDSVSAGTRCRNAVGSPDDIGVMGIFQISQWEQDVSRKNTSATLPKNIDRRVLFDNALIFASITKNRAGTVPKDCNNWPDDVIKMVAEKHHGVCNYNYGNGNTGNYCTDILKLYKQYK